MKLRMTPHVLRGNVRVPPSKSLLHREAIAQTLAGGRCEVNGGAEDVQRTLQALSLLLREDAPIIDCGESGSTLRFLVPVAMARGQRGTVFTGSRRLLSRPFPGDWGLERSGDALRITRALRGGIYQPDGHQTSQLISGLLLALPLCGEDSEICLPEDMVSRPYVEMTAAVIQRHGVSLKEITTGWQIPGKQLYRPAPWQEEGDWSAAAWYFVLNALGADIAVEGLREDSLQGDRAIRQFCAHLPETVDLSQNPDLLPPLALLSALQAGKTTHFVRASFLRGKESDRLRATTRILRALGGQVTEQADGLSITGVAQLQGGCVDSFGDHRMAMLAGCAVMCCREAVQLKSAECVSKSYPDFWKDYVNLGGHLEVLAT